MLTEFLAMALAMAAGQATDRPGDQPGACTGPAAALPADLAGWTAMTPLVAGADAIHPATLTIGVGADATLLPTPRVRYALRPEKPGGSVSSGGMFAFVVPAAGRYRVALGSGAWIDVVRDGRAVTSVDHGHGPACTGVRKMVAFDLVPGRYLLQVVGNGSPRLALMVAPVP